MGGAASKTKQTKKEAGGPMRGVVPGAGQDEAAVGDGAAAGGGAAAAVPVEIALERGHSEVVSILQEYSQ